MAAKKKTKKEVYYPTAEEIVAGCEQARARWSAEMEAHRRGVEVDRCGVPIWTIPQGLTTVDRAWIARK